MKYLKKYVIITLSLLFACFQVKAQENEKKLVPFAEIFTDFHFSPANDTLSPGFAISRAWFGGDFITESKIKGSVIINLTKLIDTVLHEGNNSPVREASIGYDNGKIKVSLGITGTRLMQYQLRFYDKRYIANTFQSLNGYGYLFDLGLAVDYRINKLAGIDFTLMNGDGIRKNPEGGLKASLGLNLFPKEDAIIRLYCDTRKIRGIWQTTLVGFAGFTWDIIKIGAEINYKTNHDIVKGHNAWGISSTGSVALSEKLSLFARYDYSASVTAPGDVLPWNNGRDGKLIILGAQRTLGRNARMAIDYQAGIPNDINKMASDMIYLHAHFRF